MSYYTNSIVFTATLLLCCSASNAEQQVFPDPLTLDYVLNYDIRSHPVIQLSEAKLQSQRAQQLSINSRYDITADIQARLQYIEPSSIAIDQSGDDHKLSLFVRKTLYDFGRTSAASLAAYASTESSRNLYVDSLYHHRITILASFFDVLLADLRFLRDNEAMAAAFIKMDRAQARNELGQTSEIEVLELDNNYQIKRQQYYISQNLLRTARTRLANNLGRPGQLINEMVPPKLSFPLNNLPEVETLQQLALQNNPRLLSLQSKLNATTLYLEESRAANKPVLSSHIELSDYARVSSSHDKWRANLTLTIPILSGGEFKAETSKRRAEYLAIQSEYRMTKTEILQAVLESWLQLENLRIIKEQKLKQEEYRDLYLDRSRTLYELEAMAQLGDSMIEMTSAQLETAQTDYQIALVWAKLQALLGQKINIYESGLSLTGG